MRAFVRIEQNGGTATVQVWTGDDWNRVPMFGFNWIDFAVPISAEPPTHERGNFVFSYRSRTKLDESNPAIEVDCRYISTSNLPAVAEILPALIGGRACRINLFSPEGISLLGMTEGDLSDLTEYGYLGEHLFERMDQQHQRLLAVVSGLRSIPNSDRFKIFGSAAAGKELPGDIDVYADTGGLMSSEIGDLSEALIDLAGRHYGYLDPFLVVSGKLHTRNDAASGWQVARNAAALRSSGEGGIPERIFDEGEAS